MKYNTSTHEIATLKTDALCIPVFSSADNTRLFKSIDAHTTSRVGAWLKHSEAKLEHGEIHMLPCFDSPTKNLMLVCMGDAEKLDQPKLKAAMKSAATKLKLDEFKSVTLYLKQLPDHTLCTANKLIDATIEAVESQFYEFDLYKTKKAPKRHLSEVSFIIDESEKKPAQQTIKTSYAIQQGRKLAKDLGNQPGNVCTPSYMAEQALLLEALNDKVSVTILEEKDLKKLKMGAFLSVSKGSVQAPKLVTIEYAGGKKTDKPHVLVGKGITFDSGGISLKPGALMDEMKYDMCGAASVVGTLKSVIEMGLKLNVVGVIACAENMPAGHASKPGDIVTTASGKTVEILNTDAEGRLVLCDTLTYVEKFKPASVVDIATLTGACIVALGHHTSALMSNDDALAEELQKAGSQSYDRVWRLPLFDEYHKQLDSPFADLQNIGGPSAGSITAACFLSKFTENYTWAHLDIAGVAWVSGGKDKSSTGRPVPLLSQYLINKTLTKH